MFRTNAIAKKENLEKNLNGKIVILRGALENNNVSLVTFRCITYLSSVLFYCYLEAEVSVQKTLTIYQPEDGKEMLLTSRSS